MRFCLLAASCVTFWPHVSSYSPWAMGLYWRRAWFFLRARPCLIDSRNSLYFHTALCRFLKPRCFDLFRSPIVSLYGFKFGLAQSPCAALFVSPISTRCPPWDGRTSSVSRRERWGVVRLFLFRFLLALLGLVCFLFPCAGSCVGTVHSLLSFCTSVWGLRSMVSLWLLALQN